jgi:hypothetical protein
VTLLYLTDKDDVAIAEGDVYQINTEDGPMPTWNYYVEVQTAADLKLAQDGKRSKVFVLAHPFRQRQDAKAHAVLVRARGVLNLDHWAERETWPLEEKWAQMGQQEWEVGHDFRAEHDLYHGIP